MVLPSTCAAPHLANGRLAPVLPGLTLVSAEVTLLRSPRHRNAHALVNLGERLSDVLAEAEGAVQARRAAG